MAANIFAMEAMTLFTASLVDRDKHADIRVEAAMCKLWGSEMEWEIVNETMQIRGGRGYETADSLKARGEEAVAVERFLRDSRINTIFEGSSEIMRLFIAREALDPHLRVAAAVLNSRLPKAERFKAMLKAGAFYASWYPRLFWPLSAVQIPKTKVHPALRPHLRYAQRTSRRLARSLFHAIARFGPKLERRQLLLGRFVDIGTELFAIVATCARAESLLERAKQSKVQTPKESKTNENTHEKPSADALGLADFFCRSARLRIEHNFRRLHDNVDRRGYDLAQHVLKGECLWLEDGIVDETLIELKDSPGVFRHRRSDRA
jgi:hypothetical protein